MLASPVSAVDFDDHVQQKELTDDLVDYINRQRKSGQDLHWVVSHAGNIRFRPIVLTSITTFVGLTPMMADNTISTGMFVPMAVSLAFGVLLGTVITLFLVPCLYMALEDLLVATGRQSKMPAADTLLTGTDPS